MARKNHERGMLQAIVAREMIKRKVNSNTKPETKTAAFEAAAKTLGDKDDSRARQIGNWMLRHQYKLSDIASRLKEKATKSKSSPRARKTPAHSEETKVAA